MHRRPAIAAVIGAFLTAATAIHAAGPPLPTFRSVTTSAMVFDQNRGTVDDDALQVDTSGPETLDLDLATNANIGSATAGVSGTVTSDVSTNVLTWNTNYTVSADGVPSGSQGLPITAFASLVEQLSVGFFTTEPTRIRLEVDGGVTGDPFIGGIVVNLTIGADSWTWAPGDPPLSVDTQAAPSNLVSFNTTINVGGVTSFDTPASVSGFASLTFIRGDDDAPGPGDADGDGDVDFEDLLNLLSGWGTCRDCPGDFDADGDVDFEDVLVVLSQWTG
ncbi:MAG: hypothetical protein AB8G96_00150 [Phycisphaerales bacterium]